MLTHEATVGGWVQSTVEMPFRKLPLQAAKRSRLDSEWSEDVAEDCDATDAIADVRA